MTNSPSRKVSRADVARAAGVSVTTVTHALNPPPGARVKPATAARVKRIAAELGYRPSFVGRALVAGKTYAVGLLQPSHEHAHFQLYQDVMIGMSRAMEEDDYHLLLMFCSPEPRYLRTITQGRVDGVFVLQSDLGTNHIDAVIASGIPAVVVNKVYQPKPGTAVGSVSHDHRGMMRAAVDELVAAGCRSLLLVIDPRWVDANVNLHLGFINAAAAHTAAGAYASTMTPDDFPRQLHNAFAAGQRWDGIIVDGVDIAEVLLTEAETAGLAAGRDFQLITSDTRDGRTTHDRRELCAYTMQPELQGAEAWRLMRQVLNGEFDEQTVALPYRRHAVADA